MRKPRRWLVFLGALLCVFGLLFLLNALCGTPAEAALPEGATPAHAMASAPLLTAVLPSTESAPVARGVSYDGLALALLSCLALTLPLLVSGSDANGRVLRKGRYVRSFYPVFKQELACG